MSKSGKKLVSVMMSCALAVGSLTGCAQKTNTKINVIHELNSVKSYQTAVVERGKNKLNYTFYLIMEGYLKKNYMVNGSEYILEQLFVSEGDHVNAGDVLIRFKSDEKIADIEEYKNKIAENERLIEHYELLMKADKNLDYKDEIAILKDDNELNKLYIGQFQTQIDFNEIKAEYDSYITHINPQLAYFVESGRPLVIAVTVTDKFGLKTDVDYEFEIGKNYIATDGDKKYELIAISSEPLEDGYKKIIFELKDKTEMKNLERLKLDIEDETDGIEGCFLHKDFIYHGKKSDYVYLIDDEGNLSIKEIVVDRYAGNYAILSSGLNEGERVAKF